MKVLLVGIHLGVRHTPLALLYLRAVLKQDVLLSSRLEVQIGHYSVAEVLSETALWRIVQFDPDVVGLSCYVWNLQRTLDLVAKIRRMKPATKIVLGGPEVAAVARRVLEEHSDVDVVVKGEGEFVFRDLIGQWLGQDSDLSGVRGIVYRQGGQVHETPPAEPIRDLNSIPSPYLQADSAGMLAGAEACVETMRGCPFRCGFCYYHKGGDAVRMFSTERIKRELMVLLNADVRRIYLMDPTFNTDRARAREILEFVAKHNSRNIPLHTEIHAEFIDEPLVDLIWKAHVRHLEFGLQSTDEEVLRGVNRRLNPERFMQGLRLLKRYEEIDAELSIIYGLPRDTLERFKATVEFTVEAEPVTLSIFRLIVLPGTQVWGMAKTLGIEYEERPLHRFLCSPTFPYKHVIQARRIANSIGLFMGRTIRSLARSAGIRVVDLVEWWLQSTGCDEYMLATDANSDAVKRRVVEFVRRFAAQRGLGPCDVAALQADLGNLFIATNPTQDAYTIYTKAKSMPWAREKWPTAAPGDR